MARSRRKYKASRAKVRVALPKKNPNIFKPAFNFPPKLRALMSDDVPEWNDQASVIQNYKSFGVVSNPNLLGIRSRTDHMIQDESLNVPPPPEPSTDDPVAKEFEPIDSGSELEEDDLKTALGKQRKDGKSAPLQPLTTMQRKHISRLVEKYGDDIEGMCRDRKLNSMQHSFGTLLKLCTRYEIYKGTNPILVP
ncbi:hypothetical protein AALP_AA1G021500 [Arabis alpina]|uniref:Nucleolar protein 16 n=1 Tax=Arabis alpina TaxID=50452 RepID=A0A087HKI8_ARAAL|nr:hypothetical protein AALP_AA1G021500 [Arabis alpina]